MNFERSHVVVVDQQSRSLHVADEGSNRKGLANG